ncbi:hypothetical protein X928_04000 [Petrotoga miotherma DSM 10691]|uniref:Uncharacterized protein n=1 Tax=Petrotoga miotherma DSM 10691 TaxID=1434326 RepID=A0A2K1PDK0_9BACT|nr:hypothetical protein X928_04000 [Petrotoga miotherma DSM 10691]
MGRQEESKRPKILFLMRKKHVIGWDLAGCGVKGGKIPSLEGGERQ